MVDTDAIIESFARHLMTAFDRWNENAGSRRSRGTIWRGLPTRKAGERRGIDVNGDLLVEPPAGSGAARDADQPCGCAGDAPLGMIAQARGPKFG